MSDTLYKAAKGAANFIGEQHQRAQSRRAQEYESQFQMEKEKKVYEENIIAEAQRALTATLNRAQRFAHNNHWEWVGTFNHLPTDKQHIIAIAALLAARARKPIRDSVGIVVLLSLEDDGDYLTEHHEEYKEPDKTFQQGAKTQLKSILKYCEQNYTNDPEFVEKMRAICSLESLDEFYKKKQIISEIEARPLPTGDKIVSQIRECQTNSKKTKDKQILQAWEKRLGILMNELHSKYANREDAQVILQEEAEAKRKKAEAIAAKEEAKRKAEERKAKQKKFNLIYWPIVAVVFIIVAIFIFMRAYGFWSYVGAYFGLIFGLSPFLGIGFFIGFRD